MTAPVTPVEVANLTLDVIKTENVENIEDVSGDEIAAVINRWWDVSRRKCLEGFPWYFASARKSIQLVSPAPDFGYTDQYRLPNGFVGLNFITDESLPLSKWDYTIEGDYLLINNSGAASLNIGYVKDTTNVSNCSSLGLVCSKTISSNPFIRASPALLGTEFLCNICLTTLSIEASRCLSFNTSRV